ncbi:TRAP transporter small permease [Euzebya pacifica]|uniref:TRAP transporter small permease n=1 Tax=Euzebya pacifica TaxID=1608957 RepID=UPI0030F745FE
MTTAPSRLDTAWRLYVRGLQVTVAGLLLAVIAITLMNVLNRWFGLGTVAWTDETARRILIWMTFVGGALAVANGSHLRIDTLSVDAGTRLGRALRWVVGAVSVVFFLLLVVEGARFALSNVDRLSPAMEVSTAWTFASGPIGGLLFLLAFLGRVVIGEPDPVLIDDPAPVDADARADADLVREAQ